MTTHSTDEVTGLLQAWGRSEARPPLPIAASTAAARAATGPCSCAANLKWGSCRAASTGPQAF